MTPAARKTANKIAPRTIWAYKVIVGGAFVLCNGGIELDAMLAWLPENIDRREVEIRLKSVDH